MSAEDARARLSAQATRATRLAAADLVVDNDGTLEELRTRVEELWADLTRRAAAET